jgi:hypothetical protein
LVGKTNENRPILRPGYRYRNNIEVNIVKNNIAVKFDEQAWIGSVWSKRGLPGWLILSTIVAFGV